MPRPKQRTPALRAQVLDAALDVLARDGVPGLTARRVAAHASTSVAAVYELYGAKEGLVRALFFEGFARLGNELAACPRSDDAADDLLGMLGVLRRFVVDQPALADVMFSRPFTDFDPGPGDAEAPAAVRRLLVGAVRRCVDAGALEGDPVDVAHVLLALGQGMAAQETAGWLGTSSRSVERRWRLAEAAALRGFAPAGEDRGGART